MFKLHPQPEVPPDIQLRLDKLRSQAQAAEDRCQPNYASQKRAMARAIFLSVGYDADTLPEWAAERPRGNNVESFEQRAWLRDREKDRLEAAEKQAAEEFYQEELAFETNTEMEGYQWYQEHGATFIKYLTGDHHCFANLALWDALRRLAIEYSTAEPVTKYHNNPHPVPCPLPPACGRTAFLASLPPGTPDLGKTPQGRQVLQDDLTI